MTTEQKISLRDAIDADLRGEKVEFRDGTMTDWKVATEPTFDAFNAIDEPVTWRPAPKEPLKRWVIDGESVIWMDQKRAEYAAKLASKDLIELTETSRQSFKREPVRFWGTIAREGSGVIWWPSYADAVKYVNNNGGRVVEFRELA